MRRFVRWGLIGGAVYAALTMYAKRYDPDFGNFSDPRTAALTLLTLGVAFVLGFVVLGAIGALVGRLRRA